MSDPDEVAKEAEVFLRQLNDKSTDKRFQGTKRIIEGYETPYGLELLATTDWIIKHQTFASVNVKRAVDHFKAWNERKKSV